jgi:hypothetical protein
MGGRLQQGRGAQRVHGNGANAGSLMFTLLLMMRNTAGDSRTLNRLAVAGECSRLTRASETAWLYSTFRVSHSSRKSFDSSSRRLSEVRMRRAIMIPDSCRRGRACFSQDAARSVLL